MALFDDASLVTTPNGYKAGTLYSIKPTSGAGDMTVVRATTATRVNSAGLIESVANNVPRLDYSNGSCPSLLVEPQRTNLILYSEQFNNAAWGVQEATISANATVAPDGTNTADKLIESNNTAIHEVYTNVPLSLTAGSTYTKTVFAKSAERTQVSLNFVTGSFVQGAGVIANLTTGTLGTVTNYGSVTGSTATITNVDNGWYRISITMTPASTANFYADFSPALSGNINYLGNGTSGIFIWGAQIEAGSYPTSYIPTTSAAVTRNADIISKTGISSLIGQTEGVMFAEFKALGSYDSNNMILALSDGTASNRIFLNLTSNVGHLEAVITSSGSTTVAYEGSTPAIGYHKVALAYKNNDVVVYIDGALVHTDTSATIPATSKLNIGSYVDGTIQFNSGINSVILFPTRLTNAELASLTTL